MQREPRLRGRPHLVRLLILREIVANPRISNLKIAKTIGVTPQAVSGHVAALVGLGLVSGGRTSRVATAAGIQAVQDGLQELKRVIDAALESVARVDVTSAVAGGRIRKGDRVGLFMEHGELVARPARPSPSVGTAVGAAEPGHEVLVTDLRGVVDLTPGRILVLRAPGPDRGGVEGVSTHRLGELLKARGFEAAKVAAEGTGARLLARRAGLRPDFQFAATRAAFNAAELGLDVVLVATEDRMRHIMAELDGLNQSTLKRVPIQTLPIPG